MQLAACSRPFALRNLPLVPHQLLARRYTNTPTPAGGLDDPVAYCRELVRKNDYESFLLSPFYPKELQGGYFALKAFYVELATVQEAVSNDMIGKMRMQFWKDAVKGITDGRPPRHPIALALFEASQRVNLPAYHLKRIIDAREHELHAPSHLTVDSAISHAEATTSTLLYLLLALRSLHSSSTYSHAASHLGVAQSIATLLRALPFHASKGRMVIPAAITAKHGVNQEDVFRTGPGTKGMDDAVFEFATVANDHLMTARDMFKETGGQVSQEAFPIFLAGVPVQSYLTRLEGVDFNAFHPSLQLRDWKMPWKVWRSSQTRRF
ncbi:hypothetical protein JAAARDRAFT_122532 [Jaapia argillacea MUCL 33604]|uniref:Phytoene synthase n=1 Tax=Jaapia argillacea MUCL 33604 TaxID=933084 RepID=A0A067Q5M0_9AGAM|nr:hypothetical protein JAAARDRAFT_122532 [Jaapia argillacea MUCL 33604]